MEHIILLICDLLRQVHLVIYIISIDVVLVVRIIPLHVFKLIMHIAEQLVQLAVIRKTWRSLNYLLNGVRHGKLLLAVLKND